jgi:hypothetical protein
MLIITAAGISGLLFEWLRARLGLARAAIVGGAAIALAVAALAVAAPRAQPGTPLERFFRYLPRTSVADGAYELFWRRDGYGLAAVQAFRESPASGVGIGTFTTWSPAYFREAGGTYTIPPDNAQNLWRHVLAERGVLGLLPVAWLTVLAIATLPGGGPIVLRAVLAGVGVTLLFGFPVQESAIAVTIGLLVALARVPREGLSAEARAIQRATADSSPEFPTKVQDRSWWLLAVLAVSLVAAGIDVAAARGKMRLPARAARFGLPYNWGFGEQEQAPGGVTARAFRGHAALVRPAATNRFELRGWVRSPEGDAHIRIWNAGTLIFNVSVPHGGTFAQTINVPPGGRSVWLDFHTSRGDVLVSGTFEGSVAP